MFFLGGVNFLSLFCVFVYILFHHFEKKCAIFMSKSQSSKVIIWNNIKHVRKSRTLKNPNKTFTDRPTDSFFRSEMTRNEDFCDCRLKGAIRRNSQTHKTERQSSYFEIPLIEIFGYVMHFLFQQEVTYCHQSSHLSHKAWNIHTPFHHVFLGLYDFKS